MSAQNRTVLGVIGGFLGFVAMSAVAGVLVTSAVTPAIALTGIAANNTIGIFENLPEYLEISELAEKSDIYGKDAAGNPYLLASFYAQNREIVGWDEISPFVKDAAVAAEDPRFFEHGGVDLIGTVRAATTTALGRDVQGGSSITQQYVKNVLVQKAEAILDPVAQKVAYDKATETTPERKVKEMKLAIGLEKKYTKDQILLGYLNIALFGGTVYGIQAASEYYFNTSAKDLTVAQAASLIAIVNNPDKFRFDDPNDAENGAANGYAATLERRNYVVGRMFAHQKITEAQTQEAAATPISPVITQPSTGCQTAGSSGFFCDYVTWVIKNDPAFGADQDERDANFKRGGYQIYTTIDAELQNAAVSATNDWIPKSMSGVNIGSASVSVEVGTGRILAMTQNKDYSNDAEQTGDNFTAVNYNTDFGYGGSSGFQVGSTYKVFTLAEWLKEGHALNESVDGRRRVFNTFRDSCTSDGMVYGANWNPGNDEGGTGGVYTALQSTVGSINTGFAGMAEKLDLCEIRNTATALDVHRADGGELEHNPSAILGTNEIAPLTMATAIGGIANKGVVCSAIAIDSIVDRNGAPVAPPASTCHQGLEPGVAATTAFALQAVMSGGTGAPSNPRDGTPLIGKTGTTDDALHTWMLGSSTKVATATWVGNVSGFTSMRGFSLDGVNAGQVRHRIWPRIMSVADARYGGDAFPAPQANLLQPQSFPVPDVRGKSPQEASATLTAAGFTAIDGGQVDSEMPAGTVASTNPAGGSNASKGSQVTFYTSKGNLVLLPNVVGQSEAAAKAALTGFSVRSVSVNVKEDSSVGTVRKMDPGAGTALKPGSTITISIGKKAG